MKESEVWPLATEIWEKREKLNIIYLTTGQHVQGREDTYYIKLYSPFLNNTKKAWTHYLDTTTEVRRFLDGLE